MIKLLFKEKILRDLKDCLSTLHYNFSDTDDVKLFFHILAMALGDKDASLYKRCEEYLKSHERLIKENSIEINRPNDILKGLVLIKQRFDAKDMKKAKAYLCNFTTELERILKFRYRPRPKPSPQPDPSQESDSGADSDSESGHSQPQVPSGSGRHDQGPDSGHGHPGGRQGQMSSSSGLGSQSSIGDSQGVSEHGQRRDSHQPQMQRQPVRVVNQIPEIDPAAIQNIILAFEKLLSEWRNNTDIRGFWNALQDGLGGKNNELYRYIEQGIENESMENIGGGNILDQLVLLGSTFNKVEEKKDSSTSKQAVKHFIETAKKKDLKKKKLFGLFDLAVKKDPVKSKKEQIGKEFEVEFDKVDILKDLDKIEEQFDLLKTREEKIKFVYSYLKKKMENNFYYKNFLAPKLEGKSLVFKIMKNMRSFGKRTNAYETELDFNAFDNFYRLLSTIVHEDLHLIDNKDQELNYYILSLMLGSGILKNAYNGFESIKGKINKDFIQVLNDIAFAVDFKKEEIEKLEQDFEKKNINSEDFFAELMKLIGNVKIGKTSMSSIFSDYQEFAESA